MATQVQFRRGTATQNNAFTGSEGELSVNLSNYSLRLHDGVSAGGYEIARQDFSNATFGATVLPTLNTTYNLGSGGFKFLNVYSQEFTGALTGNADTATSLQTARTINGVSFDGTADITIEASIDKTLFINEGLEDSGGLTSFDGGTDVTLRLKNAPNFSNNTVLRWDDTNTQFVDSAITDDGTTVTISGNLNVTGSTTTISTTNLEVTDKLIVIGDGATTTQGADGAGFNIGTSGVSLTYDLANTSWTSSESWNLTAGKTYKIAGNTVIGSTSLGANIVGSSLTSVGTLTSLDVSGNANFDGVINFNSSVNFNSSILLDDNDIINIGNSNDLKIYHNGNDSYIDNTERHLYIRNNVGDVDGGDIFIQAREDEYSIVCYNDSSVYLFYDNNVRLGTNTEGVEIYGDIFHRGHSVRNNAGTQTWQQVALNKENLTAGVSTVVDIWPYAAFSVAEYVITFDNYGAVNGGVSEMQVTKLLVMVDDTGNIWTTEQGSLYTDETSPCFTASVAASGSNVELSITPNSSYTNNNNDLKVKTTVFNR
jgi:hypothetical protein